MNATLAQLTNPVLPKSIGEGGIEQGGKASGLLLGNLIGGIFVFAFILAFIFLITGGIRWITAGGDKGKLEEARNRVTHSLIGAIVVASAWAVATIAGQFLGLEFPNLPIPTIQ